MSSKTISGSITTPVALTADNPGYTLAVAPTGEINPSGPGAAAVYIDDPNAIFSNQGQVEGTQYSFPALGEDGVKLVAGYAENLGTVIGGLAGTGSYGQVGGTGVVLQGGLFVNSAVVEGGAGYNSPTTAVNSSGGAGLEVTNGIFLNKSTIVGGHGQNEGGAQAGGAGAQLDGGTLLNTGVVLGGSGSDFLLSGVGGAGVTLDAGLIFNDGVIQGAKAAYAKDGIFANAGPGGIITGGTLYNDGVIIGGNGNLDPYGRTETDLSGYNGAGLYVQDGVVLNHGLIEAGSDGLEATAVTVAGGTLVTWGTIAGGVDAHGTLQPAVVISSSGHLVMEPGAIFSGGVSGSGDTTLELGFDPMSSNGTLDLGNSFSGISELLFDPGSSWDVSALPTAFSKGETIAGFTVGDTISLTGFAATSETLTAGTLALADETGTLVLNIGTEVDDENLRVISQMEGTEIELLCYLSGTNILTPVGEVAIEDLKLGDAVVTRFGGYQKIKWIGTQSYDARFIQNNLEQVPVCITANALEKGVPKRDLYVSPGHSMLIGDVLVLAKALVNGISVAQPRPMNDVRYYQLEFEKHDCVLAEGAWSESYADTPGLRAKFHNVDEFYRMFPAHQEPVEQLLCATRPTEGRSLNTVLRPIVAQASMRIQSGPLRGWIDEMSDEGFLKGWAQDIDHPDLPVLLEVLSGNICLGTVLACDYREDLARLKIGGGYCAYKFQHEAFSTRRLWNDVRVRRHSDGAEIALRMEPMISTRDAGTSITKMSERLRG